MSPRRSQRAASLPAADLDELRTRVRALAENRPAVYRMLDSTGRILYVGKAKRLRTRLLCYFRADYPDDKAARILHAASSITWDYVPSEFAAYLNELRQIRQYRPHFNHRGNMTRRSVLIKISNEPAPRVYAGSSASRDDAGCYGPYRSLARTNEAVRTLNDLLGLRDCAARMPMVFAGQGDLFDRAAGRLPQVRVRLLQRAVCGVRRRAGVSAAGGDGGGVPRGTYPPAARPRHPRHAGGSAAGQFELAARWRENGSSSSSGCWPPPAAPVRARGSADLRVSRSG